MSEVKMKMMDGNEAAASVAHRMNEVCVIYPITPSLLPGVFCFQRHDCRLCHP